MPGPSWWKWASEVLALHVSLAAATNQFTTISSNGWCTNAKIVQIDDVTVESSASDCETRCATEPGSCKGYSYAPGDGGSCDSLQTAFPGSCYLWSGACGFTTENGACWSNHFIVGTGTLSHNAAAAATKSTTTPTAATTTTTSTSKKKGTTSNEPGRSTAELEEVTTTALEDKERGTSSAAETAEKATTSEAVTKTTTAAEPETETSTTEVSTTSTEGWSIRHSQSSCMNMASIKLGDAVVVDSAGLCAQRCQEAEGCVGFGFQSGEQAECTNGGGPKGSCYLWRSSCMIEPNQCWDQYIMGSLASCTSLSCPSGYGLKKQEPPLQCAGSVCDLDVDKATCCAPNFMCSTFSCPSGYTSRVQASDKLCKEQVCTAKNDLDTCCQPVVSCSTLACPTGFRLRSNANALMCGSNPCDPDTDWAACCQQQAKCSTFTCLAGYAGRPNAENLYCQDATCTEADNDRCCIERGDEQLIAKGQHPMSAHSVASGQNASSKAAPATASSQTGNNAANCPATPATCDMTGLEPPFAGQEIGAFDVLLCPGQCILGRVYGMQAYTQSSLVCKAAVFSGVISSGGGYIKVRLAPGLPMYDGGLRNGVETFDHGATNTSIVISVPSLEDFCASRAITTTTDMPWGLPWWAWLLICCGSTFLLLLLCWLAMSALGGGGDDGKKNKKKDQDRREKEAKKSRHRHHHHRDDRSKDDYYLEADPVYRRRSFEPPPPSNVNPPWLNQEAPSHPSTTTIVPYGPQSSGYTASSPQLYPAHGSTSIQYPGGGAPVPIRPAPNASGSRRSSWASGPGY